MSSESAVGSESDPAADAPLKITVIDPSGRPSPLAVTRSPFRIGRSPGCELSLHDNRISRNHAQILCEDRKYFIEDCGSRHGLFVNGGRVERHELAEGDQIDFGVDGSYRLRVGSPQDSSTLIQKMAEMPESGGTGELGRLSAVLEVARALHSSLTLDDVLVAAVDAALTVTECERGFLMLRDGGGELEVKVARSQDGHRLAEQELLVPTNMIEEALLARRDLLSMTLEPLSSGTEVAHAERTIRAMELRHVVCVPLVRVRIGQEHETSLLSAKDDTLGVLYMDSKGGSGDLSAGNRQLLQTLAIEISTVLENARLLTEEREKKNLEQQLSIAREIQQSMLPASLPQEGWLVAAGSSQACYQVGGDYFDVTQVGDDHWGVVLADVSGKGVSAALMASLIQGAFFASLTEEGRLSETVTRINRYLCERSTNARFATVFYSLVRRDGTAQCVNAGHCPGIVVRASGQIDWLNANTIPLGLFQESEFPVQEYRLGPGDKLVLYSDGVSEATNRSQEQFGEKRVAEVVAEHASLNALQLFDTLGREIEAFTDGSAQDDDVTLLVLGYQG